jgi:mannose-1-phosphate guanylyltransferase / mannose-6-phosphate isomerase
MNIYPVILCGGAGNGLWPAAQAALPKQLLALTGEKTMLQASLLHLRGLAGLMAPTIVCALAHRFHVSAQLHEIRNPPLHLLLEPEARGTAPAVAVAALQLLEQDADAVMLVLPGDLVVGDAAALRDTLACAVPAAAAGALVTFGIAATHAQPGHSYLRRGASFAGFAYGQLLEAFIDKPAHAAAQALIDAGGHDCHSGIVMLRADRYIAALRAFDRQIVDCCARALQGARWQQGQLCLASAPYAACQTQSINTAVLAHARNGLVLPLDCGWSDIDTWSGLWEVLERDTEGNTQCGDVHLERVSGSMVRAGSRVVAVIGVRDLMIVETPDAVLVAHKDEAARVRQMAQHLHAQAGPARGTSARVDRPWGHSDAIDAGKRFQVRRITLLPGARLAPQLHHHRAAHWIVVGGTARVSCSGAARLVSENESAYIPIGAPHCLENPGRLLLQLIEVQSGCYLDEDDVVRLDEEVEHA